ncbi:MAG TPA: BlaI/MecI/CopY family transcriptional regulator [Tepidisphaeraceae bacterium]|nr:BlaI/MecI/CopY family transcriptional regulator [Tepidisphaeraceae bacterium]
MTKRQPPRPTAGELAILRVLWERGPGTVREVWEQLKGPRPVGYTTVLKLLQIMANKGLVARDDRRQSHVYSAAKSQEQTQRVLVRDLLERAFGGSARTLILRALDAKKVSADELAEIRTLLDQLEGEAR